MGKASPIGVSGAKLLVVFTLTKNIWDQILNRYHCRWFGDGCLWIWGEVFL